MLLLLLVLSVIRVSSKQITYTATVDPENPSSNGVTMTKLKDVTESNGEWIINPSDEIGFHLKITLDSSYAFHSSEISTLTVTIGSNLVLSSTDIDLITSFSQSHSIYLTQWSSLSTNSNQYIYPSCSSTTTQFGTGNIEAIVSQSGERDEKAMNGWSGYNTIVKDITPTLPLEYSFENHPNSYCMLTYTYQETEETGNYQCKYAAFDANVPLEILLASDDVNSIIPISYINITMEYITTDDPTTSPSPSPLQLRTESLSPSQLPSESPSQLPILSAEISEIDASRSVSATHQAWFWAIMTVIFILICAGTVVIYFYWKKRKIHQKIVNMLSKTILIKNPLCIFFAIGDYEENPSSPDINAYCRDLNVDIDITNLLSLFRDTLKYDVVPNYSNDIPKVYWTQKDVIKLLQKQSEIFAKNVISNESNNAENKRNYDGLIIVASGHGLNNHLITSDMKLIDKNVVHRMFSSYYAQSREVPRIIIYDMCDGNEESKSINIKQKHKKLKIGQIISQPFTIKNIPIPNSMKGNDIGKNYKVDDISNSIHNVSRGDSSPVLWEHCAKNPDHNLAVIHAANLGFQSKMNSEDGSYLINKFVSKTKATVEQRIDKKPFLLEIMDEIQKELGEIEKKQLPTYSFNSQTGYLKFIPRSVKDTCIEMNESDINEQGKNVSHIDIEMKNNVLTTEKIQATKQQEELYNWLNDIVNLVQYYHVFVENGFDDLDSLTDIKMEELETIGIDKLGHRKKLLKFIKKID